MDESMSLESDIFHLAQIALSGKEHDVRVFVRKLSRKYGKSSTDLSSNLQGLLKKHAIRESAIRRVEPTELPVDSDSRLPLIRVVSSPELEIEPVYEDNTWAVLRQIVREHEHADRLERAGVEPTRSLLFTGPPGVGKTYGAHWIAGQLGRPLAILDLSAVMSSFLGRTGNNVRAVLDYAKERRCVLLLDELDAVAKRRDDSTEIGELKRLVTVLLQEIDQWPSSSLLIAATNHPELLDPAVWRRFEAVIDFPLPSRSDILKLCRSILHEDVSSLWANILSVALEGRSPSDVVQALKRAQRMAAINDEDLQVALEQLVQSYSASLDRGAKQTLAIDLIGAGLSQRQVSDITGVSRDTIRKHAPQGNVGA
jgi:SpoVK/Ycf46/Vps4 family AAA+-type ATPase